MRSSSAEAPLVEPSQDQQNYSTVEVSPAAAAAPADEGTSIQSPQEEATPLFYPHEWPSWAVQGPIAQVRLAVRKFRKFPLIGWLPLVINMALGSNSDPHIVFIAIVSSFAIQGSLTLLQALSLGPREVFPVTLDTGSLFLWFGLLVYAAVDVQDHVAVVTRWSSAIIGLSLMCIVLFGMAIKHPFTLDYSVEAIPEHVWAIPQAKEFLVKFNYVLTGLWACYFLCLSVFGIVGGILTPNWKTDDLRNKIFAFGPLLLLLITFTIQYLLIQQAKKRRR